jgi:hypothetical protein
LNFSQFSILWRLWCKKKGAAYAAPLDSQSFTLYFYYINLKRGKGTGFEKYLGNVLRELGGNWGVGGLTRFSRDVNWWGCFNSTPFRGLGRSLGPPVKMRALRDDSLQCPKFKLSHTPRAGDVSFRSIISTLMRRTPRKSTSIDPLLSKPRKQIPHQFVLDALAPLSPITRPMFGCLAIYVGEKIVLILREKPTYSADNGVWLATTEEHHASLRSEFPHMRSIGLLGKKITGWQVLPSEAQDFEEAALRACELVLAGDPRVGKVPGARRKSQRKKKSARLKRSPRRLK